MQEKISDRALANMRITRPPTAFSAEYRTLAVKTIPYDVRARLQRVRDEFADRHAR
jgi:hypothetical protein